MYLVGLHIYYIKYYDHERMADKEAIAEGVVIMGSSARNTKLRKLLLSLELLVCIKNSGLKPLCNGVDTAF